MDDCFQVNGENIEFKEAKQNFNPISDKSTEIEIKEEPIDQIVDNFVGVSEIKQEQNEELCNMITLMLHQFMKKRSSLNVMSVAKCVMEIDKLDVFAKFFYHAQIL